MYCTKCGKQIDAQSQFCPYCGTSVSTTSDSNVNTNATAVQLIVRRKKRFFGSLVPYKFYIDKQLVASISNGEEMNFSIAPGVHSLTCDLWSGVGECQIQVPDGARKVVVEIRLKVGLLTNKIEIVEVERSN